MPAWEGSSAGAPAVTACARIVDELRPRPPLAALFSVEAPPQLALELFPGLWIEGIVGRTYRIEYAEDVWEPVAWRALTNLVLTRTPYLWIGTLSTNVMAGYYRAVMLP